MWDLTLTKTAALRTTKNIQSIQKNGSNLQKISL